MAQRPAGCPVKYIIVKSARFIFSVRNRIKQIYDMGKNKTGHEIREIPLTDKSLKF